MAAPRKPVSDFGGASALADADLVPVIQSGVDKKSTVADMRAVTQGLLSARPAASSVPNGATYFATDVDGGTLYTEVSNAWVTVGSVSGATAGTLLTSVWPSGSIATIGATLGGVRVPELTTPTFTMPDREVRVMVPNMAATIVSGYDVVFQVRFDVAAAGTYAALSVAGGRQIAPNTVTSAVWAPIFGRIRPSVITPGSSVTAAIFVSVADFSTRNVSITNNSNGIDAGLDIVIR